MKGVVGRVVPSMLRNSLVARLIILTFNIVIFEAHEWAFDIGRPGKTDLTGNFPAC